MSKLFKWLGGGKKKKDCKEPCCTKNKQNKLENISCSLESASNEGGSKKLDQVDGKKFSKALTSCPRRIHRNCRDQDVDSLTMEPADYGPQSPSEVDYMPVGKHASEYNMNHPNRGKALIFNFDKWDNTTVPSLTLKPRLGSAKDRDDLSKCLGKLEFQVETHNNLTAKHFWDVINQVKAENHRDNDCIVVAILTHGEKNHIYMKCGTLVPVNLVWEAFEAHKCPTLAAKPKIFIVQACRGNTYDDGTTVRQGSYPSAIAPTSDTTDAATFSYVIPNAADIVVAFSCPLGHYSWRSQQDGSWFIQALCEVFTEHGTEMEILELLTIVARKEFNLVEQVALDKESSTDEEELDKKKQVTSTSTTLIRKVMFRPKSQGIQAPPPTDICELNIQLTEASISPGPSNGRSNGNGIIRNGGTWNGNETHL